MIQIKHGKNIYIHYDSKYANMAKKIIEYYEIASPLLTRKWGGGRNTASIHIYLCENPIEFMLSAAKGIRKILWQLFLPVCQVALNDFIIELVV